MERKSLGWYPRCPPHSPSACLLTQTPPNLCTIFSNRIATTPNPYQDQALIIQADESEGMQRRHFEQAQGEAEDNLRQLLEDIGARQKKAGALGTVLKEECQNVPGGGGKTLDIVVGE